MQSGLEFLLVNWLSCERLHFCFSVQLLIREDINGLLVKIVLLCKEILFDRWDRSELVSYTCKEAAVVFEFSQIAQFFSILEQC